MEELANASRVNGAVSDFLMAGRELFPEVVELDLSKSGALAAPVARRIMEGSVNSPSVLRMGTNRKADSVKTEPVRPEPVKPEPVLLAKAEPEKPLKPLPPIPRSAQMQQQNHQQAQQREKSHQSDEEEEESTN